MKKLFVFLGVILSLVTSSHGAEMKTYNSTGSYFNYSIDYPSDWQVGDTYGFVTISPLKNLSEDISVTVTIADLSKKPKTLEEFNSLMFDKIIPQELSNFQILDKGKAVIDGKESLFYVYKGNKEGKGLKYKQYSFKNNTNIYELTFEARIEDFDRYLPKVENIIKSIKVKK